MADCIRTKDILAFLNSESGRRMTQAAGTGSSGRNSHLFLGVAASEDLSRNLSGYSEKKSGNG